jgi:hypothetical protein
MKHALVALLVLASLLCAANQKRKSPKPPEVEVIEATARRAQRIVTLDGRVRNSGERPVQGLTLLFSMMAPGGQVITTQKGTIEEEVLEPGEEAEFHWQMKDPVRAVDFKIDAVDGNDRDLVVRKPGPYPIE